MRENKKPAGTVFRLPAGRFAYHAAASSISRMLMP